MSLRFRRSVKLMPGVRLNFNKNSTGLSFGVPGARYTINSKGRRTATFGIPGTGLYDTTTLSSGRSRSRATQPEAPAGPPKQYILGSNAPKPGLFASKAERAFRAFLIDIYDSAAKDTPAQVFAKAKDLREHYEELRSPLELITFLHGVPDPELTEEASSWAPSLWKNREALFGHPLSKKYLVGIHPAVPISRGISTDMPYNAQTLGYIYAELLQADGKYAEALEVLGQMNPDPLLAIATADIEISSKDFDGAIETTEDVENEDDVSAMLLILRGIAFRGKGLNEASLECFKRALAKKGRDQGIMSRAHFERADTYIAMGKKSMAVKDLEKILVDDPQYDGVSEKLTSLR